MSFFRKMKERLLRSSSQIDEGLAAIVDEGEEVEEQAAPAETALPPVETRDRPAPAPPPGPAAPRPGMWGRAVEAMSGTRSVRRRVLDDAMLEELEELLITADMGVDTALKVSARLAEGRFGRAVAADEIKRALADEVAKILDPVARPLPL